MGIFAILCTTLNRSLSIVCCQNLAPSIPHDLYLTSGSERACGMERVLTKSGMSQSVTRKRHHSAGVNDSTIGGKLVVTHFRYLLVIFNILLVIALA